MTRFAAVLAAVCCTFAACADRNPDDAFVNDARRLHPSVVLLSMKVPPENAKDKYDDGYATGIVVATGTWGSDILTVQHAIDEGVRTPDIAARGHHQASTQEAGNAVLAMIA